ncbi:transcriptional regulator, RpiR family [Fictibacillus solisalsi]|uniref:Transcriptional regulator, RpiR family n=1 Tax=Fictibacillus solisalsi TaxID=459525 RepID=A0A1H0BE84_9BACL|nr:MurR/RpiR family transcriptional regulator [Fictibacillus solisalsi]SDN43950.1 transcriptional regulator, RpiR family [Fictibacillus solisalsi]
MNYYERTKDNYPRLTKGLKKIAEALMANPIIFATYTAKKNAETLDVSETMVIRFCKALGYHGYQELQADVQSSLLSLQPVSTDLFETEDHSFGSIMNVDAQNILHAASQTNWSDVESVVEQLLSAKETKIVGYYHSFSYAHWFSFILNSLLNNATLYRPETDTGLRNKGKEYCVVIFSYYRYALESIRIAEEAKENGNTVIIITDSLLSPICHLGDYVLSIQIAQKSILEKGPVTFSLLNSILLHIANKTNNTELVNPINKYYIK